MFAIFEITYRPYSLRSSDLMMMPDGIFEAALGVQYMGVRLTNISDKSYRADAGLTISAENRAQLASLGIVVLDNWLPEEQQALGQQVIGRHIVIGALGPLEARTLYFKVDCSSATAQKPDVEFEWIPSIIEPPDPLNPAQRMIKKIFVSRTYFDAATGEMVTEVPEGRLRVRLRELIVDQKSMLRGRLRDGHCPQFPKPVLPLTPRAARKALKKLLKGRGTAGSLSFEELWAASSLIAFYAKASGLPTQVQVPPPKPGQGICSGRFRYFDFFVWPKVFDARLEMVPFEGVFSPIPFEDPWWKVALLILAVILLAAAAASAASDLAYHDEDLIIGKLERFQQDDVDAAVALLNGSREIDGLKVLDAQSGEVSTIPLDSLNGRIPVSGAFMTNMEIMTLLATPGSDRRVFKSGARTGLTHAIITSFVPWTGPRNDGALFNIPQVRLGEDPNKPMPTNNKGDSGSVWIHTATRRIVGLHHSGDPNANTASASPIESVLAAMKIRLMP
jgi:hypothetical protein